MRYHFKKKAWTTHIVTTKTNIRIWFGSISTILIQASCCGLRTNVTLKKESKPQQLCDARNTFLYFIVQRCICWWDGRKRHVQSDVAATDFSHGAVLMSKGATNMIECNIAEIHVTTEPRVKMVIKKRFPFWMSSKWSDILRMFTFACTFYQTDFWTSTLIALIWLNICWRWYWNTEKLCLRQLTNKCCIPSS